VLRAAGGKWNRKARAHVFDRDPREALGLAVETGQATNVKKALQAFYTPPELAARMAALARVEAGHLVLEPSAGQGALCEAVEAACREAKVIVCDLDPVAVADLRRRWDPIVGVSLEPTDFLQVDPEPIYDRIVMNPPFTKGQDIAHVTHALGFLKPGGRLVALTAPGWRFAENQTARSFRALLDILGAHVEEVPAGTFKASGTGVATVLVVVDRPARAVIGKDA
jgi:predicted RNA methylase